MPSSGAERREKLERARLQLIFTPELCGAKSAEPHGAAADAALARLALALPFVDVVQVRPKPLGLASRAPCAARDARDWTLRVLATAARALPARLAPLVLVDDRVDVARLLADEGCDGVHIGQDDAPPRAARAFLGPELLIGLSTHDADQVARAGEEPVDALGFGPIFASPTKGSDAGLGPQAAWVAERASRVPLFAIGGIDLANAGELHPVARAAVGAALLASPDPARAARELRTLLAG